MARCSRCNKFLLRSSQTGYCNDCYTITVNQENERRQKEQEQKRLEEEARKKKEMCKSQIHYQHIFYCGPSNSEFSKYDIGVGLTREEENLAV